MLTNAWPKSLSKSTGSFRVKQTTPLFSIVARILLFFLLLYCALFLPWWVVAVLSIVCVALYSGIELLVVGLFMDVLYATPASIFFWGLLGTEFIYTIGAVLLVVGAYVLKKSLIPI